MTVLGSAQKLQPDDVSVSRFASLARFSDEVWAFVQVLEAGLQARLDLDEQLLGAILSGDCCKKRLRQDE